MAQDKHAEAEMACKKALAACPNSPAAVLNLAALLASNEKHQDAVQALDQLPQGTAPQDHVSSQVCCPLLLHTHCCNMLELQFQKGLWDTCHAYSVNWKQKGSFILLPGVTGSALLYFMYT